MSILSNINESIKGYVSPTVDAIKKKLFGANNERLDFIMDSFYKLSPQQQSGTLLGIGGLLALFVLMAFFFYFSRVRALERELDAGFAALHQLRTMSGEYRAETENLNQLKRNVERKSADLKRKPFMEQKASQVGVTLEGLRDENMDFPEDTALAKNFNGFSIEFRIPKVSIPKLLKFLGELEKADKSLSLSNLQIRARYGDRLFFDTQAKVIGYKAKNGG